MELDARFERLPAPVPVRASKQARYDDPCWDQLEAELSLQVVSEAHAIENEIRGVAAVSTNHTHVRCCICTAAHTVFDSLVVVHSDTATNLLR